jgi:hypothetical protein
MEAKPVEDSGRATLFAKSEPEQKGFCHACRRDSPRTSHRFYIPFVRRLPMSGSGRSGPSRDDEVAGSFHGERSNNSRSYRWRSGGDASIIDAGKLAIAESRCHPRGPGRQLVAGQVGGNRSSFGARFRATRSDSDSEFKPTGWLIACESTSDSRSSRRKLGGGSSRIGSQFFSHANCIAWSVRAVNGDGHGWIVQASRPI